MKQGNARYQPAYERASESVLRLRGQELRLRSEAAGKRPRQDHERFKSVTETDEDLRSEAPVLSIVIGALMLALLFNAMIEATFR